MSNHSTPARGGQPIRAGGRIVGHVSSDTFRKTISGSKHLLRKPAAIAFDLSTLDDAEAAGAVFAEVTDRETGRAWRASIAHIRRRGFDVNRGHGRQVALVLSEWRTGDEPATEQLSLFGPPA
jgi:hypothetical protein